MNLSISMVSLSAAALLCAGPLQGTLQPITPQAGQLTQIHDFDAAPWTTALGDTDLTRRKQSYEQLLDLAQKKDAALDAVKAWAADTSNLELAWTAQLLLRELEQRPRAKQLTPFGNLGAQPFGMRSLDDLFDQFPGHGAGGLFGMGGMDPFGGLDLDQLMQGGTSSRSGLQVFQDADGVRVEVTETENGKTDTKTYEAPSMEELLETYPELQDRLGSGGGLHSFHLGGGQHGLGRGPSDLDSFWQPNAGGGLRLLRPSLERLGIQMLTPEHRTLTYPGASAEVGLQVVAIVPGSLADLVGIREGDLVTSIDGHPIQGADDVRSALQAASLERKIDIRVIDKDGTPHTRSWVPRQAM